jgi:hypothetical protein
MDSALFLDGTENERSVWLATCESEKAAKDLENGPNIISAATCHYHLSATSNVFTGVESATWSVFIDIFTCSALEGHTLTRMTIPISFSESL